MTSRIKAVEVKPTTKPSARQITSVMRKIEDGMLADAVRGPKAKALTPEQIKVARGGGFA